MKVKVRIEGGVTAAINVNNGLRQGCTLVPVLFNLYFSAVVGYWRSMCPDPGVELHYRVGRKLVGDRTAKSRLQRDVVTESQFADDAAVYATTKPIFDRCTELFISCAARWGLTVSLSKTKCMTVNSPMNEPVSLGESTIKAVTVLRTLAASSIGTGSLRMMCSPVSPRLRACSAVSVPQCLRIGRYLSAVGAACTSPLY